MCWRWAEAKQEFHRGTHQTVEFTLAYPSWTILSLIGQDRHQQLFRDRCGRPHTVASQIEKRRVGH